MQHVFDKLPAQSTITHVNILGKIYVSCEVKKLQSWGQCDKCQKWLRVSDDLDQITQFFCADIGTSCGVTEDKMDKNDVKMFQDAEDVLQALTMQLPIPRRGSARRIRLSCLNQLLSSNYNMLTVCSSPSHRWGGGCCILFLTTCSSQRTWRCSKTTGMMLPCIISVSDIMVMICPIHVTGSFRHIETGK